MITTLRSWARRVSEPQIVFPAFGVVVLAVLWGSTLNLIRVQRTAATREAALSSRELLDTYEAQVVRAIREIDLTLKAVKFASESRPQTSPLAVLRERALLPPDLIFTVSVADRDGKIVDSTRPIGVTSVVDREYFLAQQPGDVLAVSLPRRDTESGDWTLRFSRRLDAADGSFDGIVLLSVDADYFVSGYDDQKLGRQGVLGILGRDGSFRVRRTGQEISHGDRVDYATVVGEVDDDGVHAHLATDAWDGVRRYTSARELFDLPLAVVVGLSEQERLAPLAERTHTYLWRALAASLGLIAIVALLGRMSFKLAKVQQRALAEEVAHAKRVQYLAYHDGLTGLANRGLFSKLLEQAIQQARRHQRKLAVLFLDLDRFKTINDTLGHEAGDQLLVEVATRLEASVRQSDTVARMGGDEFVVLMSEVTEDTHVAQVAQKMIAALARPVVLQGQELRVTGSVGTSLFPTDGLDEQTLTKNADIAMYKAKELGKNNFQCFSAQMNTDSLERLTLESGLRHALARNEFSLRYQLKRELVDGRITGMEALLRWEHPDLGTVAPLLFLQIAEQTGLILPIGRWVLETACRQNVVWQRAGLPKVSVAINLTSRQFLDPHLLDDVAAILAETGMAAELLELEISESLLLRDVERTVAVLTGLRSMGVRIAVDDFGTGYSTLATLQRFPLDSIKIDRAFIRDVHQGDEKDLTEAIISMGRSLSLTVVAQGVETKAQADFLREHACDELQGFYFGQPLTAENLTELLRKQNLGSGAADLTLRSSKRTA